LKRLPVAIKKALQRYKTQLELRISESRLKTSEESLRNMVTNTPIAVAMFDQQMNYLVVSDAWLKHENRKEKELIGNNHYDIVPEIPEHWKKIHQEVLDGKTHESNSETMMRSNGSSEILRWRMNPWYTSEGAVGGAVLFIEDITETVQAQLRVERNEHLLAIGEELGHSGSFEFDIATQTPVWSRNMYKIKGFEPGADISHESYIKHIHPEDKDHYLDAYVQITQSVAPTLFEYRIFRPDNGKLVHLKVHSSFITNEAGEPTALMGSVQDITESVQARTSLEESEASLKSAQQIAKIGSWTLNPTDNSVTWTKELFAIHEIKEQKLEVELIRSFTHPEDLGLFDNGFQQLASGSDTDFVYRIITPAGKVKHVRGVGKVAKLENGQIESMSGTVQDVSQETTSRLELEKAQESLEIAQDIANVGSWEWCKGDQSLTISKQVLAIYETKKKQLSLDEIRSFIHPDDQKRVAKETANDFNKKIKPVIEYRLVTEKGNIKQVITSARQITNSDGKIVKLVGTVQDVTERRVMEKELEELQRNMLTRMETRVAERTTELEEKNLELRKEVWENQRISDELYHHNLDLKDSIEYAKRIQESILPDEKLIQQSFGHGFVLFLPRDIVSGDFYWYYKRGNLSYFAAIDCTGHGVPGALMSMIANELMNQAVIQKKLTDPSEVLSLLNKLM
ncbi:MAG: PAS domain-containing protein, partial [Flavobacteriales bacterium]